MNVETKLITVAVSIGVAASITYALLSSLVVCSGPGHVVALSPPGPNCMRAFVMESSGQSVLYAGAIVTRLPASEPCREHRLTWSQMKQAAAQPGADFVYLEMAVGWPFRSFHWYRCIPESLNGGCQLWKGQSEICVPGEYVDGRSYSTLRIDGLGSTVPLSPIWIGVLLNVISWSSIVYCVGVVVLLRRR